MDFFRKLDLDRDGKLTRIEFSDGIINSSEYKQSTARLKEGYRHDLTKPMYLSVVVYVTV